MKQISWPMALSAGPSRTEKPSFAQTGASADPTTAARRSRCDAWMLGQSLITPLAMDPSDPQRLYAGGDQLFRTNSGMAQWTNAGSFGAITGLTDSLAAAAVAPTDSNHALFGMSSGFIIRTTRALSLSPADPLATALERATRPRTGFVSWLAYDPFDHNIAYATYSTFGGTHVGARTTAANRGRA